MESELELDKDMKELSILAVSPHLYEEFISLGSLESLIRLLSHENTDIGNDVVSLLSELTNLDSLDLTRNPEAICFPKAFVSYINQKIMTKTKILIQLEKSLVGFSWN